MPQGVLGLGRPGPTVVSVHILFSQTLIIKVLLHHFPCTTLKEISY